LAETTISCTSNSEVNPHDLCTIAENAYSWR
jgi:hypothetical protein